MIQRSLELVFIGMLLSTPLACGSADNTGADDEQDFAESDEDGLGSIQQALEAEPEPEETDAWPKSEPLDATDDADSWPRSEQLDRSSPGGGAGSDAVAGNWPRGDTPMSRPDEGAPPSTERRPTFGLDR